jgi:hypothetical protein
MKPANLVRSKYPVETNNMSQTETRILSCLDCCFWGGGTITFETAGEPATRAGIRSWRALARIHSSIEILLEDQMIVVLIFVNLPTSNPT